MIQGNFDLIIMLILKFFFLGTIYFDAKGDAEIDNTKKRNHTYELLLRVFWFLSVVLTWQYYDSITLISIFSCILMYLGGFNVVYNKHRGLPYYYVGTTDKWYDKWIYWMSKIDAKPRKYKIPLLAIWYFVLFFIGFFIY